MQLSVLDEKDESEKIFIHSQLLQQQLVSKKKYTKTRTLLKFNIAPEKLPYVKLNFGGVEIRGVLLGILGWLDEVYQLVYLTLCFAKWVEIITKSVVMQVMSIVTSEAFGYAVIEIPCLHFQGWWYNAFLYTSIETFRPLVKRKRRCPQSVAVVPYATLPMYLNTLMSDESSELWPLVLDAFLYFGWIFSLHYPKFTHVQKLFEILQCLRQYGFGGLCKELALQLGVVSQMHWSGRKKTQLNHGKDMQKPCVMCTCYYSNLSKRFCQAFRFEMLQLYDVVWCCMCSI